MSVAALRGAKAQDYVLLMSSDVERSVSRTLLTLGERVGLRLAPFPRGPERGLGRVTAFIHELAIQDWLVVFYLATMLAAVYRGVGPLREHAIRAIELDLIVFWAGLVLGRTKLAKPFVAGLAYRLALVFAILGSFLQLHLILPTVSSRVVDADLLAFDLRVFHFEPALSWDRFVTPSTTEWFSFFYYSYFFVFASHVLLLLFAERRREVLAEASLAIVFLYCVSHLLYMVVPAYGPWVHLEGEFANSLSGGLFWRLVKSAVDSVGARTDVFPSLHTAGPVVFVLISFRNRHLNPYKYTWPIVLFFTSQIILATMFLRWHYLVDVVAGMVVAFVASRFGARVSRWETERRIRMNAAPTWMDLSPPQNFAKS